MLLTAALLASCAAPGGEPSPAERRQALEDSSAEEKRELLLQHQRFLGLSPAEQQQLRELHSELAGAADGERLRHVMAGYTRWLKTLSSGQRADLLNLPPEARVAKIKQLLQQQESARLRGLVAAELSDQDLKVVAQWMEEFLDRRLPELLDEMPLLKERLQGTADRGKRRFAVMAALRHVPRKDLLQPSPRDIAELKTRLSATARGHLEAAEKKGEGAEFMRRLMGAALFSKKFAQPVDEVELRKFYQETLTSEKREELESMPPERMRAELRRLYFEHHFRQRGGPDLPPSERPWGPGQRPFPPWYRERKPPADGAATKTPAERPRLFPKGERSKSATPPPADASPAQ